MSKFLILLCCFFISACEERAGLAPVYDARDNMKSSMPLTYRVQRYETLYAIAFRYDQDYRTLASLNGLYPPYALQAGQVIYLKLPPVQVPKPIYHALPRVSRPMTPITPAVIKSFHFRWPTTQRRILASFSPERGRKGFDILGHSGAKIYASYDGVVAYAGDGLSGYGHMIIIKHNDKFLTAYAHNKRNLVREGQKVYTGQVIAEMGMLDRQHFGVHYEIRQWGKPVNPSRFLSTYEKH